jgi:predicted GTPase
MKPSSRKWKERVSVDRIMEQQMHAMKSAIQSRQNILQLAQKEGWKVTEMMDEIMVDIPSEFGLKNRNKLIEALSRAHKI